MQNRLICVFMFISTGRKTATAVSRIWLITLLNVLYIRRSVFTSPKSAFGCMILVAYIIYKLESWKQLLSYLFHPPPLKFAISYFLSMTIGQWNINDKTSASL